MALRPRLLAAPNLLQVGCLRSHSAPVTSACIPLLWLLLRTNLPSCVDMSSWAQGSDETLVGWEQRAEGPGRATG